MADYHLIFNTDKNCLFYFYVTALSVLRSLTPSADDANDSIIFHVLIDDSVNLDKVDLYEHCLVGATSDCPVKFSFEYHNVDVSHFESVFPMTQGQVQSFSTYYRLLLATYLPEDLNRVLYLDIDLYVNSDVRLLFKNFPINDNVCYMASEPFYLESAVNVLANPPVVSREAYDADKDPLTFNVSDGLHAGVILINLEQWRKQNIAQQCLDQGFGRST